MAKATLPFEPTTPPRARYVVFFHAFLLNYIRGFKNDAFRLKVNWSTGAEVALALMHASERLSADEKGVVAALLIAIGFCSCWCWR